TDLLELMRRAQVVAAKLNLDDASEWIKLETGGYPQPLEVPAYRVVPTQLEVLNPYHGWNAVDWGGPGRLEEHFSSYGVRNSISEIVEMTRSKGKPGFALTQGEMEALKSTNPDFGRLPSMRSVSRAAIASILEGVRNEVLSWSLELEKKG